jgi:hypothetical protein
MPRDQLLSASIRPSITTFLCGSGVAGSRLCLPFLSLALGISYQLRYSNLCGYEPVQASWLAELIVINTDCYDEDAMIAL